MPPGRPLFFRQAGSANTRDEYDAHGVFIGNTKSTQGIYSTSCRYALPFAAQYTHGPSDWDVLDMNTGSVLLTFTWNEDALEKYRGFRQWNPRRDPLLMVSTLTTDSNSDRIEIYDLTKGTVIHSFDNGANGLAATFTADGAAIVRIKDNHVVFERLPESR